MSTKSCCKELEAKKLIRRSLSGVVQNSSELNIRVFFNIKNTQRASTFQATLKCNSYSEERESPTLKIRLCGRSVASEAAAHIQQTSPSFEGFASCMEKAIIEGQSRR